MRAIVLAAGQGSRLAPLTDVVPKCLLPLNGRSLLDRARDSLAQAGVRDLWVVAGHRSELILQQDYQVVLNERYRHTNIR
jgi:L-glutamine-phosphate cytidylyltransferase